jgi:hypothetical protein
MHYASYVKVTSALFHQGRIQGANEVVPEAETPSFDPFQARHREFLLRECELFRGSAVEGAV